MKITKIAQQVKQTHRFSIFIDTSYSFSLSDAALLETGLYSGQELSEKEVRELKQKSSDDKVYSMALRYAAMRLRSRHELEFYLKRKQAPEPLISQIISKLVDLHFIDDEIFAKAWVENRRLLKPSSRGRLRQELRVKRVPDDIIAAVLSDDGSAEQIALSDIIKRKRKQVKYQDDTKLMHYLARQGFHYDAIKDAIKNDPSADEA